MTHRPRYTPLLLQGAPEGLADWVEISEFEGQDKTQGYGLGLQIGAGKETLLASLGLSKHGEGSFYLL